MNIIIFIALFFLPFIIIAYFTPTTYEACDHEDIIVTKLPVYNLECDKHEFNIVDYHCVKCGRRHQVNEYV